MTIRDSWVELRGQIMDLVGRIDRMVGWIDSLSKVAAGVPSGEVEVPQVPQAAEPVVVPPTQPPVTRSEPPIGGPGVVPPEVVAQVVSACREAGFPDPAVLLAIEIWETGWFGGLPDWPSLAWRQRANPGGMKNAPAQFREAGIVTDRDPEAPTYLRFQNWMEGIRGHAWFLAKGPRYAAIHTAAGPEAMIDVIGGAGYAEGNPSWLVGVKGALAKAQALVAGESADRPSPHFTWAEVARTSHAIPNDVPEALKPGIREFAAGIVEPLRAALGRPMRYGVEWSSWYRSSALNAAVGGAEASEHLVGRGLDVPRTEEMWKAIRSMKAGLPVRCNVEPDHYDLKVGTEPGAVAVSWIKGAVKAAWEV